MHTPRFVSGAALLGWQVMAFVLGLTGFADLVLASWPDPAWFSLVLSIVVAPPVWLAEVAVGLGTALCFWALAARIQKPFNS